MRFAYHALQTPKGKRVMPHNPKGKRVARCNESCEARANEAPANRSAMPHNLKGKYVVRHNERNRGTRNGGVAAQQGYLLNISTDAN